MSKFNKSSESVTKTTNYAGGEAFVASPELEFVSILLTSFVSDQYYRKASDTMDQVTKLLEKIDPLFAAKAAIYARTKFGMRSITHVVAAELFRKVNGKTRVSGQEWPKRFVEQVVYRPDDAAEILSYYFNKIKEKSLAKQLQKGLRASLGKFDEYQLAKYRGEGKAISLVDIVNLTHPKPNEKNMEALKKLVADELRSTETWESKMTAAGKNAKNEEEKEELRKEVWTSLIKERKLGYFALLKNLRNIIEQTPEMVEEAAAMLTDEKLIQKSLILPFRFMTAMKQLQADGINNKVIYAAINKAMELSFQNVPKFDGKTLVVVDHSGSMDSVEHGNMSQFEIGAMFAVAMSKANDADFIYFGSIAKYYGMNPLDTTTTIVKELESLNNGSRPHEEVGHGTNFNAIFEEANKAYDRIVIFSDMQGWIGHYAPTGSFHEYKKRTNAHPKIYSIDLSGLGTLQFPEKEVYCLAGFSEKIFTIMGFLEQDKQALIHEIEEIKI